MMSVAINLMNSLSYPKKMTLITSVLLIPILVSFFLLIYHLNKVVNESHHEQKGLEYLKALKPFYQQLPQHRGMTNAYLNGAAEFKEKILSKRQDIQQSIEKIDVIDQQYGSEFQTSSLLNEIKKDWLLLSNEDSGTDSNAIFTAHTQLITKIRRLMNVVNHNSGLIVDPELETTFIIETIVSYIPLLAENIGQTRGLASGIVANNEITTEQRIKLTAALSKVQNEADNTQQAITHIIEHNPKLKESIGKLEQDRENILAQFIHIIQQDILETNSIKADADSIFNLGSQAISANYVMYDYLADTLTTLLDERLSSLQFEKNLVITIIVIALVVALYLFIGFYQATVNMIRHITQASQRIAMGDLTIQIDSPAKDETADIFKALNDMTHNLNNIVNQLRLNANELAAASEELSANTLQSKSNSQEQQNQSEQIATAMNEMSSTIREIAQNAELLAEEVRTANNESQSGQAVITETVKSIHSLTEDVGRAAMTIAELSQSSEQIGSVLTVIKGVAEQTNLLALNAAIEAARAGDHGRGFAVVADEVRSLANRTQESAEQIQVMVDNLQQKTKQAVLVMDKEKSNAAGMVQYTESATQSILNIVNSMTQISDMSTHVASAAEEQGLVSEEINRNITRVSDLSEDNLHGSEQISIASQNLASLASQLNTIVQRFKV